MTTSVNGAATAGEGADPVARRSMNLRIKAASIHLGVSAVVAGLIAVTVLLAWFPGVYTEAMGAYGLLVLILGCDVVIGPLLSLIVCSPGKPRRLLVVDYAVIVSLQVAALVYGLSVIVDSRPVFTVFAVDRFNVVAASDVEVSDLQGHGGNAPYALSWHGPTLVALKMPQDTVGRNAALDLEMSGKELHNLPRYYAPYSPRDVLAKAEPLGTLLKRRPQLTAEVTSILGKLHLQSDAVAWLPVQTHLGFRTALLRRDDASIVETLAVDPFD
jgi:hypothetical protein